MTTTETTTETTTASRTFLDRLDDLVRRQDRARLAALRRLATPPERWTPETYAVGMPLVPQRVRSPEERWWLLVAGLHALWHQGRSVPGRGSGNFGTSMRRLALDLAQSSELAEAVTRRFSIVLTSEEGRLAHHLRQAMGQLSANDVPLDFTRLLDDLRHWDHPDRYVQRNWARQYWAPPAPPSDSNNEDQP